MMPEGSAKIWQRIQIAAIMEENEVEKVTAGSAEPLAGSGTSGGKRAGKRLRGLLLFGGGVLAGAAACFLAIYIYSGGTLFAGGVLSGETAAKLLTLENMISKYYYKADELTQEQLADGLYKGLLEALDDPYSVYYTEEETQKRSESIEGSYSGIGAYVSADTESGYPRIAGVISGAPAEAAGLKENDLLCKADGESLKDVDLDIAVSMIRGESGTAVTLTILRDGKEMELEVTRGEVESKTVASEMLDDDIGYLYISNFTNSTPAQFEEQLKDLQEQGMKGLVLDLRSNPGGTVESVTEIAEYLIPEGLVFYMQYPDGSRKDYSVDGTNYIDLPITVLVNNNSASASEILSSAIQESGAGKVIGTQTYGKGVVQTMYPLRDNTAVKLTVSEYFTRNGNSINGVGVTPDKVVEYDEDSYNEEKNLDNQMEEAIRVLQEEVAG